MLATSATPAQRGINGTRPPGDLARLEDKLDRIEARLAGLLDPLPQALATATDTVDELARMKPELQLAQRLPAALELLERLTRPKTLRTLGQMLDLAEQAPDAFTTVTEMVDDAARAAEARGLNLDAMLRSLAGMLEALVQISPDLTAFFESGGHRTIAELSNAMAAARDAGERKVGLFGAMRALGDPAVQRSLGFAVELARAFGENGTRTLEVKELPPAR